MDIPKSYLPPIETKFLCMGTEQRLGSLLDGWKVVWCQPDRDRILWHIMVFRPVVKLSGCCGPERKNGAHRHDFAPRS